MKVLVSIPTFNNAKRGYTIRRTLESLVSQVFGDFRVLVVYKPSENDETLKILKEFEDKLDIDIKIQKQGYIEEAMNIIFEYSEDYDITLVTDDDAIPSKTWIQEHINIHKKHEKIGIATGDINTRFVMRRYKFLRRLLGFYAPNQLIKEKSKDNINSYRCYINDMGLLVPVKEAIGDTLVPSFCVTGVNLSFKSRLISGFRLPNASTRGLYYESLTALHYFMKGLKPVEFRGAHVLHLDYESLSRASNPLSRFTWGLESHISPYIYNLYGLRINIAKLKRYKYFLKTFYSLKKTLLSCAYLVGVTLAQKGLEEKWTPRKMREKILRLREIFKKEASLNKRCENVLNTINDI